MSAPRVLFDAPGPRARARHRLMAIVAGVLLTGAFAWFIRILWERDQLTAAKWRPFIQSEAWVHFLLPGLRSTLIAATVAITLSLIWGLVLAMGRMSESIWLRAPSLIFIEFFRAVPVLVMMIFAHQLLLHRTPIPGRSIAFWAVIIGLVFYNASVLAEVIRSGVNSLPSGQREAGLAIGLRPAQVRRAILVPQALTAMLPTVVSQLVVVLKDSALGYIIIYSELLNSSRQLGTRFGNIFAALVVAAAIYISVNALITKFAEVLEVRLRERGRTAGGDADDSGPAAAGPVSGAVIPGEVVPG